jgi:hypothetical protein
MSAAPLRWRARQQRPPQSQRDGLRRPRVRQEAHLDPHWLALLDAENVQTVILDRREDRDLLKVLRRSSEWAVDFADRQSMILVRRAVATMVQ